MWKFYCLKEIEKVLNELNIKYELVNRPTNKNSIILQIYSNENSFALDINYDLKGNFYKNGYVLEYEFNKLLEINKKFLEINPMTEGKLKNQL